MPSCARVYMYTHLHINARVSPVSRRCGRIDVLSVCVCALVGYYGESVGGLGRWEGEDARHYSCISIILE